MTFMELYAKYILAFQSYARKSTGDAALELPLAIMTSGDTNAKTLELLESNNYFGLSILFLFNVFFGGPFLEDI